MHAWVRQATKLEEVQCRAACFVHNNYWSLAAKCDTNAMVCVLDWETLKAHMLFKVINDLTKVLMNHYRPLTVSFTKSLHGHNLLLASYTYSYLPAELMYACL